MRCLDEEVVLAAETYFDLSPTDRSMAVLDGESPVTFQVIWDLVGPVDLEALAQAWDSLAAVHPILSCAADIGGDRAWQPRVEWVPIKLVEDVADVDRATAGELTN